MPTQETQNLLQQALAHHQQGRLPEAAALYQQVLQRAPRDPDALHLFGVLMHQGGQHETGRQLVEAALKIASGRADFLSNLGQILKALGEPEEAETAYRNALSKSPGFVDALANLGALLQERGAVAEAIGFLQQAIRKEPSHANAHMNLGNAFRKDGRVEDAEVAHRQAVSLAPLSEETHANLATTLMDLDKLEEAERALKRSQLLKPALAEAVNSFGFLLFNQRHYVKPGTWFRRAILLAPGYAAPETGLAELAYFSGDLEQSLRHSENALRLAPDEPQIHLRHAIRLLAAGHLEEGWREREWRHKAPDRVRRLGLPPTWQGEPLGGKRLLVCAEEGVGDEILYASILPEIRELGAELVLECDERLLPVFRRSFPDALVHAYARAGDGFRPVQKYDWLPQDKPVDYAIDAGSLALYFRRTLADFAKTRPYLKPDPQRVIQVRDILNKTGDGLKIALAWRSRKSTAFRDVHYTALKDWLPIFALPGAQVFSIQYGENWDTEIETLKRETGHGPTILPELDLTDDFDDILALVSSVDVLICPSSTLGWIGGALGKETWLFHPRPLFVQYGADGFPGFPSIKSFAKPFEESWEQTIYQIATALRSKAAK
ncbi:tetratricopeptide repeat protein [Nisaea denitrificans]|uniref:tetratricopeptide repeat protein n=1 Tax=Nisaea denitrificans TaxID=390877 RepID=UPI00042266D4|nr:tetratricopeptide repeat protein [Nisaea denitrificans]